MRVFNRSVLFVAVAASFFCGFASTPTNAEPVSQEGGLRFIGGDPQGAFGDAVPGEGFGLSGHYGLRPQPSLTFGVGADILVYGSESQTVRLPLVEDFELNTNNNIAGFFLFAQLRPFDGAIQPYAEARAGFNYFWTESKLEDKDFFDDDEVARQTNYDDFTTFYGAGGGVLIRLSHGNRAERKPGVFLDLKATYLQGGEAEYLTEGDIEIVNDIPVFDASRSHTDRKTFEIGVVLTF